MTLSFGPTNPRGNLGGVTDARFVATNAYSERLRHDLKNKAEKRVKLPERHSSTPFIVAIQNDRLDLDPRCVLSTLTGSRVSGASDWPIDHPDVVPVAYRLGWKPLLDEWDYGEHSKLRIDPKKRGALLETEWARELSGVLVIHGSAGPVQWLPNPFARAEINEVKLLELPFSWRRLPARR